MDKKIKEVFLGLTGGLIFSFLLDYLIVRNLKSSIIFTLKVLLIFILINLIKLIYRKIFLKKIKKND